MRLMAGFVLALFATTPAWAQGDGGPGPGPERGPPHRRFHYVDPSAVLATEIALARQAQEKGQWTAFRKMADPQAQMFVPQRVDALPWLKRQANPAAAVRRQARAVWASCDGSIAVTTGEWRQAGAAGSYATVWRRQEKGDYRWLLDMRLQSGPRADVPEMITALVADCDGSRLGANAEATLADSDDSETTVSRDGSLRWTTTLRADGSRRFTLDVRQDGQAKPVLDLAGSPPDG